MATSIKPSLSSLKFSATARFGLPRSSPNSYRRVSLLHLSSGMRFRYFFPNFCVVFFRDFLAFSAGWNSFSSSEFVGVTVYRN